ncbi:hypothetical protein PoB_001083200 [Plakobranchus ocellatus]|uniref:Uncharacterized protein n=1 Tax=Plakobranchus ocellatus TaxID=259542 RepID=A0AAV3YPH0_9GAST|nr:hypothetical protein PoB_001083200 [Plakobranchus ocellatus]
MNSPAASTVCRCYLLPVPCLLMDVFRMIVYHRSCVAGHNTEQQAKCQDLGVTCAIIVLQCVHVIVICDNSGLKGERESETIWRRSIWRQLFVLVGEGGWRMERS